MQNRYAGDIGDFVKIAILRALTSGNRLGVLWWLYPEENHNGNGRHVDYLQQASKWRQFDTELFDGLSEIVASNKRSVLSLEEAKFLPLAKFFGEIIPIEGSPAERKADRVEWFKRARRATEDCDVVFVDPDNGLQTKGFSLGAAVAGKSVSIAELNALCAPGRTLIVYHHHTRRKGGHLEELAHWADRLRTEGFRRVDAIRSRPFSPRVFFILEASPDMQENAEKLVKLWKGHLSWHPNAIMPNEVKADKLGVPE
jgi:hypothetical protein